MAWSSVGKDYSSNEEQWGRKRFTLDIMASKRACGEPGMNKELKEWMQSCEACQEFKQTQCKKTLMSNEVPEWAWEKNSCDLFLCHGKDYLTTVYYKSNFWELDRLTDTNSATTVIKKLKAQLACYKIPRQVISDISPQFVSSKFRNFTKIWGDDHTTTSPHHSKVESVVKVTEHMLQKTARSGDHQYLALLNIRNALDSSPAQRLMGRRTRTLLTTTSPCWS